MIATFIDTSFLMGLVLEDDALWSRANGWYHTVRGPFVTTEFVLIEIANGLAKQHLRSMAENIIAFARQEKAMTILPADSRLFELGYQLFTERKDKEWGLTDCISFVVMKDMGIINALTHDHHVEQAGFRALLREDPPSN